MRPSERLRKARRAGFATATVLGILAIVALLCTAALHDALFGQQLATSRTLHQRAAALADLGIEDAIARLTALPSPQGQSYTLQSPPPTDSTSVTLRHLGGGTLPAGFSSAAMVAHRFEIESTGRTARGVHATQVQGVLRMFPATPPAQSSEPAREPL
jgi:type II secretory pathway component PulK